ncbi:PIN domain-containing protein [soil metagenome]
MTVVVDATVVVAALIDSGSDGHWAEGVLVSDTLAAPHLMPVEAANILRRAAAAGDIGQDAATLAHGDLLRLRVDLFGYDPVADRAWELRPNLTMYDAWYVALAEALDESLATLDARLTRSPGPRCDFLSPT